MNYTLLRIVLYPVLIILVGQLSGAQTPETLMDEQFTSNQREWFTGNNSSNSLHATVKDGVYSLTYSSEKTFNILHQTVALPKDKNWIITSRLRFTEAVKNAECGLIFNAESTNNVYIAMVTASGDATLARYKDDKYKKIGSRTLSKPRQIGEWNTFKIVKHNDAVGLFINDECVAEYTYSYYLVLGNELGFYISEPCTVEADYLVATTSAPDNIRIVAGADVASKPTHLPEAINTTADDLLDCISADGSVLVFSRGQHPGNMGDSNDRDIWWSEKGADGEWTTAINLGKPLNTATSNYALALSQDNNSIYVQGVYSQDGTSRNGDGISVSHRTASGWSFPEALPVDSIVNKGVVLNSHITPDGSVLIVSLESDDTFGANDLYVCFRKPDGKGWTKPQNLGKTINTVGMEVSPFIAADNTTLFFSSSGHPGYGGRDVFVSRRLDDTWLKWSEPENLGPSINTDEHDTFLQTTGKGDVAYYSSTKNSIGDGDIFQIALPTGARPKPLVVLRGKVLDAISKEPVGAEVVYEDLGTATTVGVANSSPVNGEYRIVLQQGKQYGVHARAKGYYALSESFDASSLNHYTETVKDLLLTPVRALTTLRLNNVFFDFAKATLRAESNAELNRLAKFMSDNPTVKIEISGHTDSIGTDGANITLSTDRARAVKTYLVAAGIADSRMVAKGYGRSKPVATNATEEGRQENRRVEFTILR